MVERIETGKLFPGQLPDEKCILFVRKHWLIFFGMISVLTIMFFAPIILFLILWQRYPDFFQGSIVNLLVLGGSTYLLIICGLFLVSFINYYFDIFILTNRRIVDIAQEKLFHRVIDELELLHVEDVSAEIKGVLPTFFNFGNVYVQTAGAARNFLFDFVPNPHEVSRQIMACYENLVGKEKGRLAAVDRAEGLGARETKIPSPPSHPPTKEGVDLVHHNLIPLSPAKKDEGVQTEKSIPPSSPTEEPKTIKELKEGETVHLESAPKKVLVSFNIHKDKLKKVLADLPSMKAPTVNQLADKNYYEVEIVVDKTLLKNLIPKLKAKGAEGIIQTPVKVL